MNNSDSNRYALKIITVVLGIFLLFALGARFVLLNADVPRWFAPYDVGLHIDEGYKTLSPRNLAEYGDTHWNPKDDYKGWMQTSPGSQWLYYTAFKIGGVELASARVVGVFFFIAIVVVYLLTFWREYPRWTLVSGALLLSLEPFLYHFSRTALFEIQLAFTTCLGLFAVYLARNRDMVIQLLAILVAATLAWQLFKPSGFLYLVPAIGALVGLALVRGSYNRKQTLFIILASILVIIILLALTLKYWLPRIELDAFLQYPRRLLLSPVQELSPLSMAAGLLCLVHGLSTRPREYLGDHYRLVLSATLVGVPLILAVFSYVPPRYFPPMMAVGPLLVIDHIARGAWQWRPERPLPLWARLAVAAVSVPLAWYLLRSLDYAVLSHLPMYFGEDPGVSAVTMYKYYAPIALLALIAGFWLTSWYGKHVLFKPLIGVLVVGFVILGVAEQVRTLASPTFDAQEIRAALRHVTDSEASVGGDWAPYFTLGTGRKTLYVNDVTNRTERFGELRPEYFLSVGTRFDQRTFQALKASENPALGAPEHLGTFLGRDVILFPLVYRDSSNDALSDKATGKRH